MKKIIVGGLPSPIGGITTYLRRLLHRDTHEVALFLDFYPGHKEPIRTDCQKLVVQLNGKYALIKWFWMHKSQLKGSEVFFNFSTPRALVLAYLIPKFHGTEWTLMLHHGNLNVTMPVARLAARKGLQRFDQIMSLSDRQTAFYKTLGCSGQQITAGTSYCEPADHQDDPQALALIDGIRRKHKKLVLMSGYPTDIYNFDLAIDAIKATNTTDTALCLFIYGPGPLREHLVTLAEEHDWLWVFDESPERKFNTFLLNSDLLLRLTQTDSFGISVWDAAFWNVDVLASDVCKRPQNATVISLDGVTPNDVAGHITEILAK